MKRNYVIPSNRVASIESEALLMGSGDNHVTSSDNNVLINDLELDAEGTYKVSVMEDVW